ncbi:hypothetical protein AGLY_017492 [Aphis glycines]|uniref:Uncharacterized protein n=1 Tax=Aphis glycines TaxID=307491 RepID=A0A6G0SVX0_APHGL|nr:hypothetical protein AGLY_017492 [Aphis glycines]
MATADTEDQYDKFGKHLASQMRELPLKSFIILQSKFQTLITEERLANLYGNYNEPQSQSGVISRPNSISPTSHHEFIGTTMYSEPENTYSESSGSCFMERESPQDMDILNEALITDNTSGKKTEIELCGTLNNNARDLKLSPVARYLRVISSFDLHGIACLNTVQLILTILEIEGPSFLKHFCMFLDPLLSVLGEVLTMPLILPFFVSMA